MSERRREVLRLVAEGMTNAEIGRVLHVSIETVKSNLRSILAFYGARNRSHAVALAIRRGDLE